MGSAIVRQLSEQDDVELIVCDRTQLNLLSQAEVQAFFENEKIDQVYLAAAKVGVLSPTIPIQPSSSTKI